MGDKCEAEKESQKRAKK